MARPCVADWPDAAEVLAAAILAGPAHPGPAALGDHPRHRHRRPGHRRRPHPRARRRPRPDRARRPADRRPERQPLDRDLADAAPRTSSKDLDGRIDLILDSGPTAVGLESTVLDLTTRPPRILRPGPITAAQIEHVLGRRADLEARPARNRPGSADRAPARCPSTTPRGRRPFASIEPERPRELRLARPGGAGLIVGEPRLPSLSLAGLHRFDLVDAGACRPGPLRDAPPAATPWTLDLIVVVLPPADDPSGAPSATGSGARATAGRVERADQRSALLEQPPLDRRADRTRAPGAARGGRGGDRPRRSRARPRGVRTMKWRRSR